MASNEEKTEAPTPKKKKEAIEKGQVAKSQDINSALILLSGVLLILFLGGSMVTQMKDTMGMICKNLFYEDFNADTFITLVMDISFKNLKGVLPVMGGFMIVGLIASYSQVGVIFSRKALIPDFKRLNPVTGIQKLVSKRSLVKLAMSLIKLCIMGGIAYVSIRKDLEPFMAADAEPQSVLAVFLSPKTNAHPMLRSHPNAGPTPQLTRWLPSPARMRAPNALWTPEPWSYLRAFKEFPSPSSRKAPKACQYPAP